VPWFGGLRCSPLCLVCVREDVARVGYLGGMGNCGGPNEIGRLALPGPLLSLRVVHAGSSVENFRAQQYQHDGKVCSPRSRASGAEIVKTGLTHFLEPRSTR